MAKKRTERKSRVSRLPTPAETTQVVKELTAKKQESNIDKLEQAKEMIKMELAADAPEPTTNNANRKRFTMMIDKDLHDVIKKIAHDSYGKLSMSEYINQCIKQRLDKDSK